MQIQNTWPNKRTPIPYTQRLFLAGVEHRRDDHEARGDRAFAHAEDESRREETTKGGARRVAAKRDAPRQDVDAHPFAHWKPLESEVLGILE